MIPYGLANDGQCMILKVCHHARSMQAFFIIKHFLFCPGPLAGAPIFHRCFQQPEHDFVVPQQYHSNIFVFVFELFVQDSCAY